MSFQTSIQQLDEQMTVFLKGRLNESAVFPQIKCDSKQRLVFNWAGVNYINSVGIGIWVKYLSEVLTAIHPERITFKSCPFVITEQLSRVKGFIVKGISVASFAVPYVCEECEETQSILYENGKHYDHNNGILLNMQPEVLCRNCKSKMQIDVVPQKYFAFLSDIRT